MSWKDIKLAIPAETGIYLVYDKLNGVNTAWWSSKSHSWDAPEHVKIDYIHDHELIILDGKPTHWDILPNDPTVPIIKLTKAQNIKESIVKDINNRAGFANDWKSINIEIREAILNEWISIIESNI